MSDSMIREGFLCPICMQDLGSIADLQQHFDISHAGEDKAVLGQLKDFFGKAKQKILNNVKKDRESDDVSGAFSGEGGAPVSDSGIVLVGGIDPNMWEPQEIGATRSYTDGFKRYRDSRMDRYVVETNKLVIRLDKLLSPDAPTDAKKRKAFEKAVVPWAPDSDVTLCTACGKSFSIARRRHHCRLCGGIICNRCSHFLPYSYARKLTNPAYQYDGDGFRRSSSTSSLNSILSPEGEPHIRTCQSCRVLLERRDQQTEQRNTKPFVIQLYQKMKSYMDEVNQILPTFLEMAESLQSGETTYNLRETGLYRTQLVKLFENIDLLSKRIYTLGTNDVEDPPTPTTLRLQKMVRSYATNYMQSNMMGLQALPTEEDLQTMRQQKQLQAQQKIEAERRRQAAERERQQAQQAETQEPRKPKPPAEKSPTRQEKESPTKSTLGWIPTEINTGNCDDPMIQQMNIIRGYVKQAKQLNKADEVKMLEENLRDLQLEYWKQQEQDKQQQTRPQVGAHGSTTDTRTQPARPTPALNPQVNAQNSPTHSPQVRAYNTQPNNVQQPSNHVQSHQSQPQNQQPRPGIVRPPTQSQAQNQQPRPGVVQPPTQSQAQNQQPSLGVVRPPTQSQAQNQQSRPGVVRPPTQSQAQNQQSRPGVMRPPTQSQAQNQQPSLGVVRPPTQSQAQNQQPRPGVVRPPTQSQAQNQQPSLGVVRPPTQSQAQNQQPRPGVVRPPTQSPAMNPLYQHRQPTASTNTAFNQTTSQAYKHSDVTQSLPRASASPTKSPPQGSPSGTGSSNVAATNPFEDDSTTESFQEDETNPFSESYKGPSDALNPFS